MGISLSAGVRQSLQSLQSTALQAQGAQGRLASGKRVNSAIDNPVNFFTASSLNTSADAFSGLLDGMSNSVQTIKAAATGIEGIQKLVKSLQATVKQALSDAVGTVSKTGTAIVTAAEATTRSLSIKETALESRLVGTATAPASGASKILGTLSAAGNITLSNGETTMTFAATTTSTVGDLVTAINNSGVATASVGDDGKLTLSSPERLTLTAGAAGAGNATLGFVAGDSVEATNIGSTVANGGPAASATRTALVKQFNDTRTQLDQLAKDSGFNGTNLLAGDTLKTVFNEKTGTSQSAQTVVGSKISVESLSIEDARSGGVGTAFDVQSNRALNAMDAELTTALSTLGTLSSSLGASLSVVQARQDFSRSLIDTLKIGADNLVNADTNEEGANLLALQTRQQLSQTALSLSSQADQAVLRLF